MVGHHTSKDEDGKEIDQCMVVGVAIIEKDVQMSSGSNRSLIHFLLVNLDISLQHIGAAKRL